MSNQHFHYFRVKNFKRFKDLEITNIGQFNLVLGDNNVGKTSLLEALMFNADADANTLFSNCLNILEARNLPVHPRTVWRYLLPKDFYYENKIEAIEFIQKGSGINGILTLISSHFNQIGISRSFDRESSVVKENRTFDIINGSYPESKFPLIPFGPVSEEQIAVFYGDHIQGNRSLKIQFTNSLKLLFPEIEDIEPSEIHDTSNNRLSAFRKTLLIGRVGDNYSVPLGFFGEGTIHTFYILSRIVLFKKSQLMIDEIDAGVHYSRMKDYWKVILQVAHENEVQIFATTHNRECIQCFIEALEELGEDYQSRARAIKLVEHAQTKEVLAFTKPFEKIEEDLAVGNEVR